MSLSPITELNVIAATVRRFTSRGVALEVYGTGRFLTVTGSRLPDRYSVLAAMTRGALGSPDTTTPTFPSGGGRVCAQSVPQGDFYERQHCHGQHGQPHIRCGVYQRADA